MLNMLIPFFIESIILFPIMDHIPIEECQGGLDWLASGGVSQVDLVEEIGVFSQVVSPCIFNRDVSVQS